MKVTAFLVAATLACGCAPLAPMDPVTASARSLAEAESAFAAHSLRENMRQAFLAHFAEDGVTVHGGWTNSNAYLAGRPNPPIVLDWRPAFVEVAGSRELGLSTGPWTLTPLKPGAATRHGQFVSVWRRDAAGVWKVAVDLGIGHAETALAAAPLEARGVPAAGTPGTATDLREAETAFTALSATQGLRAAYRAHASVDLRWYRDESTPHVGLAAALASPRLGEDQMAWTVERLEVARSGDLGYAIGHYGKSGASAVAGHYLRVWHRENGAWRIVMDVTNDVP
jgi:ketosteroid isomerase-like protein